MTDIHAGHGAGAPAGFAWLSLGFRPFFLGAVLFAVVSVIGWTLVYTFAMPMPTDGLTILQWHAHEMVYGYALAVIAGFLLTAVNNWTGIRTLHGWPLLGLFAAWVAARVCMLAGSAMIPAAAILDLSFVTVLVVAIAVPLARKRKWKQVGILSKLVLIGVGNLVFYLGYFGHLQHGVHWGLYGGLYLVLGLILVVGRRVIPGFIERGVGYPVTLVNRRSLDVSNLVLFVMLFVAEVFVHDSPSMPYLAIALFALNAVRLAGWYTRGIWGTPLLWGLYIAYAFVTLGFLLLALGGISGVSRYIALHSFAYGGIGLITVSMMVRVSLGHTGRDIHDPPRAVTCALVVLTAGTLTRILLPIALPSHYVAWILASQVAWIAGFGILAAVLFPVLASPRIDGRAG